MELNKVTFIGNFTHDISNFFKEKGILITNDNVHSSCPTILHLPDNHFKAEAKQLPDKMVEDLLKKDINDIYLLHQRRNGDHCLYHINKSIWDNKHTIHGLMSLDIDVMQEFLDKVEESYDNVEKVDERIGINGLYILKSDWDIETFNEVHKVLIAERKGEKIPTKSLHQKEIFHHTIILKKKYV